MQQIYIPLVVNTPDKQIDIGHQITGSEREFFIKFSHLEGQQRITVSLNIDLSEIAHNHACDMAEHDYFNHVNLDGVGPNKRVTNLGIALPSFYGKEDHSNNIESLAGGQPTADAAVETLLQSPSHRRHLLGLIQPFDEQVKVGVGYCFNPNSTYKHYWVFLSIP